MKNRLLLIAVVMLMSAAIAVCAAGSKTTKYFAQLSGKKEVPAVTTKAKGEATFNISKNAASISYTIKVSSLKGAVAAHIHSGAVGMNGPVVVDLYPASAKAAHKGNVLVKGVITKASLAGPLKGKKMADLIKAMKSGDTYVNVHTDAHMEGEIRGWIMPKK